MRGALTPYVITKYFTIKVEDHVRFLTKDSVLREGLALVQALETQGKAFILVHDIH